MRVDPPPFRAVRRDKLSQQIARQLLSAVIAGHYRGEDKLPSERELMTTFQASRSAVREALGTLAAKGILTIEQGRSTTINPPDRWNSLDPELLLLLNSDGLFDQLTEVRRIIEPEIAALAAERITPARLDLLRTLTEGPLDESVEQHVERDTQFHLELAKAASNPVLLMVVSSISELLRESRRRAYVVPGELEKASRHHTLIREAIERRDPAAARRCMVAHMDQVAGALARYSATAPAAQRNE
jgi:DNA-binding FadR family transcriptional regulator